MFSFAFKTIGFSVSNWSIRIVPGLRTCGVRLGAAPGGWRTDDAADLQSSGRTVAVTLALLPEASGHSYKVK